MQTFKYLGDEAGGAVATSDVKSKTVKGLFSFDIDFHIETGAINPNPSWIGKISKWNAGSNRVKNIGNGTDGLRTKVVGNFRY